MDVIFSLAEYPERYEVIPESEELGEEIRDVLHYSHRIVYRVRKAENVVEILRAYHGARKPLTWRDIS